MFWRRARIGELETCLRINPAHMGMELVGYARALSAWRALLKSPAAALFVVESERPLRGHRVVGFGGGVFVSAAFFDAEISNPQPGLNARIIASVAGGRPVVLSLEDLKRANTFEGLDVVFVQAGIRQDVLEPPQLEEVRAQLWLACLASYRGYRLRCAMREATDAADVEYMRSHGVYGSIFTFEDFHRANPGNPWNRDRALMVSTREDALKRPGSVPALLHAFREPVLALSDSHKQLLESAVHGLTDEELARALRLKLPAIKKRWAAVFHHVARIKPDLLAGIGDNPDRSTRGPQKRHRLLEYLREHPEELRPWMNAGGRRPDTRA